MNDRQSKSDTLSYDPATWSVTPGDKVSPDRKSAPLSDLYPEKDDYLIISTDRYCNKDFAEQEWQKVWKRSWTCAGRARDIQEPGEWFKYDLGRESMIVVRQRNKSIKAFYNACQHRGRLLVTEDFGRNYSFVCPYHSWVYGLDGSNHRVTSSECFTSKSLCGDLGLKPVRCETWAGFVFVNMDMDAPPLSDYLGELAGTLDAFTMEDMNVVKDVVLEVPCNWKAAMEAFLEPYHAHVTHAQILPAVDELRNQYDFYPNGHARVITPVGLPSPRFADQETINPSLAFLLMDAGIDPAEFKGTAHDVRKAIWAGKRAQTDNPFGIDFSRFTDSQLTDDWNPSLFPNMTINTHPEGALVMRFLPHASDPGKSYYHIWVILPKCKPGTPAPWYFGVEPDVDVTGATRPARRYTTIEDPQVGEVPGQDLTNLVAMQRGLMSEGMKDGVRLGELEQRIQQLHAEIDRLIAKG